MGDAHLHTPAVIGFFLPACGDSPERLVQINF